MCGKRCAACDDRMSRIKRFVRSQSVSVNRRWQRKKLKQDPDYRANQAVAQKRWGERNPEYWRHYRQAHPEYTARNREKQRQRNQRREYIGTREYIEYIGA